MQLVSHIPVYVTGFEKTQLPRTQQQDTLFSITQVSVVKVVQAAFAVACFLVLSDIHECSGDLRKAPSPLDKQPAD